MNSYWSTIRLEVTVKVKLEMGGDPEEYGRMERLVRDIRLGQAHPSELMRAFRRDEQIVIESYRQLEENE